MNRTAEPVVRQKTILGEGALWHSRRGVLYWIDIRGRKLFVYDPRTGENRAHDVGQDVGTVVARKSGEVMLAVRHGFASFEFGKNELKMLATVDHGDPNVRFNDGKCDPAGRFWAGTMAYDFRPGIGALYCLEKDLSVRKVLTKITISNGLVWSADARRFYYIDSPTGRVDSYDYDIDTGNIEYRRPVVQLEEPGKPDGMCIDEEGMLWVAIYNGSKVCRFNPLDGKVLETVEIPGARQVTSCALGGPKRNELFITTSSQEFTEKDWAEQPNGGSLFRVEVDVRGAEAWEFCG